MSRAFDASRSLTVLEQDSTLIAVIEMSQSTWLAAVVPGFKRKPLKKLDADAEALLKLLHRWCKGGLRGRAHRRCLRGRTRRLLARALAAGA
jgi:transposase